MIINTHTHIFPDKIAEKVIELLSEKGNMKHYGNPTLSALLSEMERCKVDYSVTLPIATAPKQQKTINDFAANIKNSKIISFGSVNPYASDCLTELERLNKLGLKGIKLHPEYQGFDVDDKKVAYPLYETCRILNLPIVFHAGFDVAFPENFHAAPEKIARVIEDFKDNVFILAHMGGMRHDLKLLDSIEYIAGKNCFMDTSLASVFFDKHIFMELVKKHGTDKIVFGTDFPWSDMEKEIEFIDSLPMCRDDKDKIFFRNAFELFLREY